MTTKMNVTSEIDPIVSIVHLKIISLFFNIKLHKKKFHTRSTVSFMISSQVMPSLSAIFEFVKACVQKGRTVIYKNYGTKVE